MLTICKTCYDKSRVKKEKRRKVKNEKLAILDELYDDCNKELCNNSSWDNYGLRTNHDCDYGFFQFKGRRILSNKTKYIAKYNVVVFYFNKFGGKIIYTAKHVVDININTMPNEVTAKEYVAKIITKLCKKTKMLFEQEKQRKRTINNELRLEALQNMDISSVRVPLPREIRDVVLQRDNFQCQDCGAKMGLEIHHVNKNPSDNKINNLLTLCRICHQGVI